MASKCALYPKNQKEKADTLGHNKGPMNAFLIFCKQQRGCMRRKYPSLENREMTRVLGEWWASLGHIDKSLYSALAHQHKENLIKPPSRAKWFRMPGGKYRKQQSDLSQPGIVPGKLADESQLGGLSSLLQLSKEPIIEIKPPLPKPLKKRYRDEVYSNIEPVVEPSLPLAVPEPKIEEHGDKSRPGTETSEKEEERLKVWRSHILEENVNTKRTRARACKGQRYREFMWTSYANRRRSNRWELNQDKDEILPIKKTKSGNKSEKSRNKQIKTTKAVNETITPFNEKSTDLAIESDQSGEKSDDGLPLQITDEPSVIKKGKRKAPKSKPNSSLDLVSVSHTKDNNDNLMTTGSEENIDFCQNNNETDVEMKNNYSGFVLLAPNDQSINNNHDPMENSKSISLQEESRKLESSLVGSKKRKARRQGIRRLAPGSTFKGDNS
nr:uncharacterized protein LOC106691294 isoform X2 [Halyomorpha halys]XP_014292509.1 uncharacterized protein LOC106691294 isoform X2 [Halyomorpha halys]